MSSTVPSSGDGALRSTGHDSLDVPVPLVAAALLGGALAWTLHLAAGVALVGDACEASRRWPLQVVNLASILLALGALAATRVLHRAGQEPDGRDTHGQSTDHPPFSAGPRRARFLATVGWFLNVAFLGLIVLGSVPTLFLDPCH